MAAKTKGDTQQNIVEKVQKLVALATSDNEEEARTAAVQAARLMSEHKLVVVPKEDVERAQAFVAGVQKRAKEEKMSNMALGAVLGVFLSKKF
jgi:hypothetical protein